jgi:hypothetical protein
MGMNFLVKSERILFPVCFGHSYGSYETVDNQKNRAGRGQQLGGPRKGMPGNHFGPGWGIFGIRKFDPKVSVSERRLTEAGRQGGNGMALGEKE